MLVLIIVFIILYFVEDLVAYKIIRYIDKKERKKINKREEEHVYFMLEHEEIDKWFCSLFY